MRNDTIRKTDGAQPGPTRIQIHLPIAAREIQVAAHDRAIYRARAAVAGTALLITSWILYSMFQFTGQASSMIGLQTFAFQSWAAFIFACGAFTATCDSISREKRDDTLGLLFLTHLKGRDVVLGKLASAMGLFVTGAIATLPILTLPVLLGGITLFQSFHLLISLLNTMLLSAAGGLFASSISVNKQKSGAIAISVMLFFCVLIPLALLSFRKLGLLQPAYILEFFTPLFPQQLASGALAGLQLQYFWISTAAIFSITCLLLAAASFITPRTWQQRAKQPLLTRLTKRHAAWTLRTINSRSPLGRELLDRNAYEWLAARQLSAATKTWTFITAMVLLATALILNFLRHNDPSGVFISICAPIAYIIQGSVKVRIGGHAADRFSGERESNALELLLCTPLSIPEMLAGEFRALRRHYVLPMIVVVALFFIGLLLSLSGVGQLAQLFTTEGDPLFRRATYFILATAAYLLVLDSITLAWAGAWCGLTCRVQSARANTMALVLAIPFLVFVGVLPAILQSATIRAYLQNAGFYLSFFLVIAFLTASDLTIIALARRWLFGNPRARLTDPLIYARGGQSFFAFFRTKSDSKPPLNIGNPAKAPEF